jgi:hypothetical protein
MKAINNLSALILVAAAAGMSLGGCNKEGVGVNHGSEPATTSAAPAANTSIPASGDTIGGHNESNAAPPGSTGGTPEAIGDHVSTGTGTGTTHTGAAGTPSDPAKQNAPDAPAK